VKRLGFRVLISKKHQNGVKNATLELEGNMHHKVFLSPNLQLQISKEHINDLLKTV
jgi:hypothetical protein